MAKLCSKIQFDARMLFASGIGTYIRQVLPALIDLESPIDRVLINDEPRASLWTQNNLPGVEVDKTSVPIYSIKEQFLLPKLMKEKTHALWSPHYNIPLFFGGKLITTIHDLMHVAMPELVGGIHKRLYAKKMFSSVAKKADLIFCDSEFTAKEMVKYTDIDPIKLKVVYLGVSENLFSIPKKTNPHIRPYLLYVGNVKPHKNLKRLVQAFQILSKKIDHDLMIVGKREGFITGDSDLQKEVGKIAERICFTGEVSEEKLHQYYLYADGLIQPSLYEGFGLPPLEAMAYGCPVASSTAGSLPEVGGQEFKGGAEDGGTVIYFDPLDIHEMAEKILSLISMDSAAKLRLIENGKARAKQFSWGKCAQNKHVEIQKLLSI